MTSFEPDTSSIRPHLDVLLVRRLADSDYRTGRLNVPEPVPDCRFGSLVDRPGGPGDDWVTRHQVEIVLHPSRGALLLRDVVSRPHEPDVLLRDRIERVHEQLVELQCKLRRRLDDDSYWRSRPVVLGVGLVVRGECPATAVPQRVPAELIVDGPDLRDLQPRLERLFGYYMTPAATPVAEYGPRLVEDLTESPEWIGNFIDEETIAAMDRPDDDRGCDDRAA